MKKSVLLIFLICLVTGVIIGTQTKVTKGEHAFVSAKSLADYTTAIKSEKAEIEKLNELYESHQILLKEYENNPEDKETITEKITKNLNDTKKLGGYREVVGEGIVVSLDDGVRELTQGEQASDIIVHDLDILLIINDLIGAGAESISINEQRIINTTEITCSGHSVRINNQFFAQPFIIKAIGDPSTLEAAMTIPGSYGELLKEYGLIFTVLKNDNIKIPAYSEDLNIKYMKIVEEGDLN